MKIILAGGSGQVGSVLKRAFLAAGYEVIVLSRSREDRSSRSIHWDGRTLGPWTAEIEGADVVINLAGRSVNCRYTGANRRAIMESRIDSTRAIGEAIAKTRKPPRVWLQSSTATIYAHRFDAPNDEATGEIGGGKGASQAWGFSIEVAKAWERAVGDFSTPNTRKVILRSAMVMSPDRGGIFDVLRKLVRFGLGGSAASGQQYVSWIHHHDFSRAISFLIGREDLSGPVNLASPEPLPYREFMRALRHAARMPVGLPATTWMLSIGAFFMRTETELVLKSRRVVPRRLLDAGFQFDFPQWPVAATDLCNSSR